MTEIRVLAGRVTQPCFGGVGFHVSFHQHGADQEHERLLWRRWRELRPSFARVGYRRADGPAGMEALARLLVRMKETGTEVYLVAWDPADVQPGPDMDAYAREVADCVESLIRDRGATNVRWYCMTNELSMRKWAAMVDDLPRFRAYHRAIHDEFRRRELPVGLLASDASPIEHWPSIEWAAGNMDDITAVYGGHHYFNEHDPADPDFYPWFLEKLRWGVGIARAKGKGFILGEFGCAQDGRVLGGRKMDVCVHFGTEKEPLVGIQLAEAVVAALNAGVYALANWTFTDYPDKRRSNYVNRWGAFEWEGTCRTRAHYYAYGLLARFFRGPASAFQAESNDPLVRAAAVQAHDSGAWSVAVVNRAREQKHLSARMEADGPPGVFRKYVYDPCKVPWDGGGNLQLPAAEVQVAGGLLSDSVDPGTLTVYTTAT